MARPWELVNARKRAKAEKPARPRATQEALPLPAPYPEHAKMYPHTQANWQIREFWLHLTERGLSTLSWDELDDELLRWRGVDKGAYQSEAGDMRTKYQWLWDTYEPQLPEIASVIDETRRPQGWDTPALVAETGQVTDALALLMSKIKES